MWDNHLKVKQKQENGALKNRKPATRDVGKNTTVYGIMPIHIIFVVAFSLSFTDTRNSGSSRLCYTSPCMLHFSGETLQYDLKRRSMMIKRYFIPFLLFVAVCIGLPAADLNVPVLELFTRGYFDSGVFTLGTRGRIEFLVAGGYKFGGQILMDFESDDLESLDTDEYLSFKGANITMRNPLGIPMDLTYFTGENDTFGAGALFPGYFGTKQIASRFRGYIYFPDEDQTRYNGIHKVSGTGLKMTSSFLTDWNFTSLYLYQDAYLGSGTYSADLWTSTNTERFKMEAFLGSSFPVSSFGYWRAGLLLFYDTGQGGEFLTQVGIPQWNPAAGGLGQIDLFYFLFEPRVQFGFFSIILTLFWHPEYYLQEETGEVGTADINAKFQFGEPERNIASGGIETQLKLNTTQDIEAATDRLQLRISPFFSVITPGVVWDFKVNTKLFPFDRTDLVEVFVGVRAEF